MKLNVISSCKKIIHNYFFNFHMKNKLNAI